MLLKFLFKNSCVSINYNEEPKTEIKVMIQFTITQQKKEQNITNRSKHLGYILKVFSTLHSFLSIPPSPLPLFNKFGIIIYIFQPML